MELNKAAYTPETLTQLKREELRCLLTEELEKETTNIDDAFVRLLLRELELRGKDPAFEDDEAVEAVCKKFRLDVEEGQKPKRRWYQSWMVKVASVVLALGILLFALPGGAKAKNIQDVLTWWSDSVFQFFSPGDKPTAQEYIYQTDHPGLQQIYDAVSELGVTDPVVPRQISKDFELLELKTYHLAGDSFIHACLMNDNSSILFTIIIHSEEGMLQYEKNAENVRIWDMGSNEHYVVSNVNEQTVTWVAGKLECTIITDCPEEEVYGIIKSIYTSEG